MIKTAFIRGNLTFWKCKYCNGWHEGENHKCPLKQHQANLDKILKRLKEESTHCTNWIDRIFEEEQED